MVRIALRVFQYDLNNNARRLDVRKQNQVLAYWYIISDSKWIGYCSAVLFNSSSFSATEVVSAGLKL